MVARAEIDKNECPTCGAVRFGVTWCGVRRILQWLGRLCFLRCRIVVVGCRSSLSLVLGPVGRGLEWTLVQTFSVQVVVHCCCIARQKCRFSVCNREGLPG